MFIQSKNREEIMRYLFSEGVIVAENKNQKKHAALNVTNLEVIQLMRGFTTRGLVKKQYAWRHYYWFLTEEGTTFLREQLHMPADVLPATLKKTAASVAPLGGGRREWRDRGVEGRERRPGGFGRGRRQEEGEQTEAAPAAEVAPAGTADAGDEAW